MVDFTANHILNPLSAGLFVREIACHQYGLDGIRSAAYHSMRYMGLQSVLATIIAQPDFERFENRACVDGGGYGYAIAKDAACLFRMPAYVGLRAWLRGKAR